MLKVNIGSGLVRLRDGYINVDRDIFASPDVLGDALQLPFANIDRLLMSHLIEHFSDNQVITKLIPEVWRALAINGEWECIAPIANSFGAVQDPDHRSQWVPQKFLYFTSHFDDILNRPDYEQRFQLTYWEYNTAEVKVKLRKTAEKEPCKCPLCLQFS